LREIGQPGLDRLLAVLNQPFQFSSTPKTVPLA
jgi:hypothetical protein